MFAKAVSELARNESNELGLGSNDCENTQSVGKSTN